jgi:O-antigen ligase
MNKTVRYLLYAFAFATVLAMSATTIVLSLLILVFIKDLIRKNVRGGDFKKDSLWYAAIFCWKAFTRTLATSVRDIPKIKGVWDRLPYVVIGFYEIPRETVLRIFHILFSANAAIVVYALCQKYLGLPALYKPLFYEGGNRMCGYFGHPNQYAGCISIILIMNICLAVYRDKRLFSYTPFLIAGVVLAGSRSYFLGIFVCFVVLLAMSRSFKTILKYSLIAALVAAVIVITAPWISQRVMAGFSLEKNVYRLNIWKISWDIFLEHPLVGVGSGMLPGLLEPYKEKGLIDFTSHAHNTYLHELAEDGIPGFLLVTGALIYFFVKYFKVYRKAADPLAKAFSLGASLSLLNLLAAGFFEYNFGAAIVALNINFLMGVLEGYRLNVEKT